MDLNLTLLGEMLTFAVLVWATVKYIWPPLTKIMEERQHRINAGLEAAKQGEYALELARQTMQKQLHETKHKAAALLEHANEQANNLLEAAKAQAQEEYERTLAQAKAELARSVNQAQQELQQQVTKLALDIVERILVQRLGQPTTQQLLLEDAITKV